MIKKRGYNKVKLPVYSIILMILSIIAGLRVGWVANDYSVKISLVGLLAATLLLDNTVTFYVKSGGNKKRQRQKLESR